VLYRAIAARAAAEPARIAPVRDRGVSLFAASKGYEVCD
jgi:hypothetical protein